jgi:hypothetical protein
VHGETGSMQALSDALTIDGYTVTIPEKDVAYVL